MSDSLSVIFLGVIAAAVLAMAIGQVVAVMMASRATRQISDSVSRLEKSVQPIVSNLESVSAEAARVAAQANVQVARVERLVDDVSKRVEETVTTVQRTVLSPARDAAVVIRGIKAAVNAFQDYRQGRRRYDSGPVPVGVHDPESDDEHASFIG